METCTATPAAAQGPIAPGTPHRWHQVGFSKYSNTTMAPPPCLIIRPAHTSHPTVLVALTLHAIRRCTSQHGHSNSGKRYWPQLHNPATTTAYSTLTQDGEATECWLDSTQLWRNRSAKQHGQQQTCNSPGQLVLTRGSSSLTGLWHAHLEHHEHIATVGVQSRHCDRCNYRCVPLSTKDL